MKHDVSIHFNTNDQTLEEVETNINYWFDKGQKLVDFSERAEDDARSVLHHCFLPRDEAVKRGFKATYNLLDSICEHHVCWYDISTYGIEWSRQLMLENLKKVDGTAIFVGAIKGGVEEEHKIATELELDIVHIPMEYYPKSQ